MIATPNLDEILGAEVVDPDNETVGKVGRIYLDAERDVPTWVTVKTGLFGLAESLVPVDDATWEGEVLRVTVAKARIKDAPRVDADQEIAPEDQERLYSYYDRGSDLGGSGASADGGSDATGAGAPGPQAGRSGASGADTEGMSRHHASGPDEPLGGGNQNPAAFEVDEEDQRLRDAGRSAGSGLLGGGAQDPALVEAGEERPTEIGSLGGGGNLGGGNQDPDRYDGGAERSVGASNLGGGNQNPGGLTHHSGVGAPTHGGPGEFTRTAGADASQRAAAEDDPGRMRMTEGSGTPSVQSPSGGGMRLRRYVVTEQQTVSVPVTREEFRLEPDEGSDTRAE